MENARCGSVNGTILGMHETFSEAQIYCSSTPSCTSFFDTDCDGYEFYTCQGNLSTSTTGGCAWEKGFMSNLQK